MSARDVNNYCCQMLVIHYNLYSNGIITLVLLLVKMLQ
jgi:hypothetical protein